MGRVDNLHVDIVDVGVGHNRVPFSVGEHRRRDLARRRCSTADSYLDRDPGGVGVVGRVLVDRDERVARVDVQTRRTVVHELQVDAGDTDEVAGSNTGLQQVYRGPAPVSRIEDVQLRPIAGIEDVGITQQMIDFVLQLRVEIALEEVERPRTEREVLVCIPESVDPLAAVLILVLIGVDHFDKDTVGVDVTADAAPVPIEEVHLRR